MSSSHYDIIVIGGGLGGLCFSILAAKQSYSVALFEKEQYPFHKVCGEYISMESYPFLQSLGLQLDSLNLPLIKNLKVSDNAGKVYDFKLDMGGFGISRYKLDNLLYQLALQNNVSVFTNSKVNNVSFKNNLHFVEAGNINCDASVVVGSFGKRSNLDVKWKRSFITQKPNKLNNYIGVKYHVQLPVSADTIALHNFKNGYCGISSIENSTCCLCYLTTAENLKASNNSIQEMQQKMLSKNIQLNNIFMQAKFLYAEPLTISQISFDKKQQVEDHVLMIGDAAGLITPLCGNGMSMAMHASKLCFEQVHLFLRQSQTRDQMEKRYIHNWKKAFKTRLAVGRLIQKLMGNNTSTSLFLKFMKAVPIVSKKLIQLTHGQTF